MEKQSEKAYMKLAAERIERWDDRYTAFHRIIGDIRRRDSSDTKIAPIEDSFNGIDTLDHKNELAARHIAFVVFSDKSYSAVDANNIRALIEKTNNTGRKYKEPTLIQRTSVPTRDTSGMWQIDLIVSTDLNYNQAKTLHRKLCAESDQKTNGELFTDEEGLIDWCVREEIKKRIEQKLSEHGYDNLVVDVQTITEANKSIESGELEFQSPTGSSIGFEI